MATSCCPDDEKEQEVPRTKRRRPAQRCRPRASLLRHADGNVRDGRPSACGVSPRPLVVQLRRTAATKNAPTIGRTDPFSDIHRTTSGFPTPVVCSCRWIAAFGRAVAPGGRGGLVVCSPAAFTEASSGSGTLVGALAPDSYADRLQRTNRAAQPLSGRSIKPATRVSKTRSRALAEQDAHEYKHPHQAHRSPHDRSTRFHSGQKYMMSIVPKARIMSERGTPSLG